jgi:O-acetyl-ADP-ribose deacetylase (regulator of RNase III)
MVHFIEFGNIFKIQGVENFAHGCNCAGAMGKGIALEFKKKFPNMYKQYKSLCFEGTFNLGDVYEYSTGSGYVYNLGTQLTWKKKADIDAIEKALKKMLIIASNGGIRKIALPKIGAGLGGLDWVDVKSLIIKVDKDFPDVELFVVENYIL